MKKILVYTLSLLLIASALITAVGCEKSYTCPNFTVYDTKMKAVELEDFIGKPIVLNFWASWCYYCKVEMPDFENAYKEHPGVRFMMINNTDGESERVESAEAYIRKAGYTFPVYYDLALEAAEKYSIDAFPITCFIDRDGNLVRTHRGMITKDILEEYISEIE